MRNASFERLRAIRSEFDAVREAVSYVSKNWDTHNVFKDLRTVTSYDLKRSAQNIEATYFVRLFAEFEGILKDYLVAQDSKITFSKDVKVDWLMKQTLRGQKIDPILRKQIDEVRNHRNSIAHRGKPTAIVTFTEALARLNRFLAKLN